MKYHASRDRDQRYIKLEINSINPFFNAQATLSLPSPAYKFELSDKELEKFAHRLQIKWFESFTKEVEDLLGTKKELYPCK